MTTDNDTLMKNKNKMAHRKVFDSNSSRVICFFVCLVITMCVISLDPFNAFS